MKAKLKKNHVLLFFILQLYIRKAMSYCSQKKQIMVGRPPF